MLSTGFEGPMTTASASCTACTTSGAGCAASMPS